MAVADRFTIRDKIAIGQGPYVTTPSWTDLSAYDSEHSVRSGSGSFATGRQSRGGAYEATAVTLTVGNRDGRYTPGNNASIFHPFDDACPYLREIEYPKDSGTWFPFWGGVLYDSRSGFEGQAQGMASLTFQQRLAAPDQRPLDALVVGLIERTSPELFYPLTDPVGSLTAADSRGDTYPVLDVYHRGYGGSIDFGTGDAPGPDTGGTRLALTPESNGDNLYSLNGPITTFTASNFEAYCVMSSTGYVSGFWGSNWLFAVRDTYSSMFKLEVTPAGKVKAIVRNGLTGDLATATSTTTVTDGLDHAVGMTVEGSPTATLTIWVDDVAEATDTYTAQSWAMITAEVGGELYGGYPIEGFNGTLANVAAWSDVDATGARRDLYQLSLDGFGAETADVRLGRVADLAGIPSTWVTTTGTFARQIAAQATQGRTFVELIQELEVAEVGRIFCDWQGRIGLASASAFYTAPQTLTLSADADFTLIEQFSRSSDNMVNDWKGSTSDGVSVRYKASDAVIDKRGQKTRDEGVLPLASEDDVVAIGHWAVNTTAIPALRFPKVRIPLARTFGQTGRAYDGTNVYDAGLDYDGSGALLALLALAEGDRMILTDLPTGSPATQFDGFVERIDKLETGDDLVFEVTLSEWISVGVFDTARFDASTITLDADITNAVTSIVTASGSEALTTTDLPVDVNIGGERVTVTAVSGTTVPQTLTVTRGTAPSFAAAHSAGDQLTIWSPGILGI